MHLQIVLSRLHHHLPPNSADALHIYPSLLPFSTSSLNVSASSVSAACSPLSSHSLPLLRSWWIRELLDRRRLSSRGSGNHLPGRHSSAVAVAAAAAAESGRLEFWQSRIGAGAGGSAEAAYHVSTDLRDPGA
jgi:hypothetical protein